MTHTVASGDDGVTLIEVLMAIVIMGIAFVALLLGIQNGIVSADAHRKQADTNTVLINAAEKLKNDSVLYQSCATPANAGGIVYRDAARTAAPVPSGWPNTNTGVTISSIQYWNGLSFGATCNDVSSGVVHVQLIQLQVVSPGTVNTVTQNMTIIKRDPT
jgi:prepilin-type N-terminal cleavage/methylation domain-containing protein